MRLAIRPARIAPCAINSGTKAYTVLPRNPRPPTRSGCVGMRLNSMRDTCQRKRIHMKIRKYQRTSRNWQIGKLTYANQKPVEENCNPSAPGVPYQVADESATKRRQKSRTPTKSEKHTADF